MKLLNDEFYKELISEGVFDPTIFKAIFLAGGPGAGKSTVVRNTTGGLGFKIVNSDAAFEHLMKQAGLSLKMKPEEEAERDVVRGKAKSLTKKMEFNYLNGRLGVIIDGTGKDYNKIKKAKETLDKLGYDTKLVFVNTSLETALARNQKRSRTVPEKIVKDSWNAVQKNIGKFQNLFGTKNFIVVDNNVRDEDLYNKVWKRIKKFSTANVSNPIAKKWMNDQLAKKDRT